jgi:hypothetical protein
MNADTAVDNFLSFDIDEDATVYVAYETLDSMFHSTIPAWLKDFAKEDGQIVAQYRYYNVFSKTFKKGKIVCRRQRQKLMALEQTIYYGKKIP